MVADMFFELFLRLPAQWRPVYKTLLLVSGPEMDDGADGYFAHTHIVFDVFVLNEILCIVRS